jgi:hypothetical protein
MRYMVVFSLIVSAVLFSFPHPQPSLAQAALSPGCTAINDPAWDGNYGGGGPGAHDFYAGETLTMTAGTPTVGGTPDTLRLFIGVTLVDTESFPGTLTYTFPADTNTTVSWDTLLLSGDAPDVTWTVSCEYTGLPERPTPSSAAPVPVPGCDALLDIPDTAVVGTFVADVVADWTPGVPTGPAVTLEAGKTAWVLGVDESGAYYKIFWGCQTLWVPVGAMGPNFDDVWHGTPLPTGVVS